MEELFAEQNLYLHWINKRLMEYSDLEDSKDLFMGSVLLLYEKYVIKSPFLDYKSLKRLLFSILRYKILEFKRKKADEFRLTSDNYEFFMERGVDIALPVPSYYWHKKYRMENKDTYKKADRKYYQTHKIEKNKKRLTYYFQLKKDPVKYAEYLKKQKERNKKSRLMKLIT